MVNSTLKCIILSFLRLTKGDEFMEGRKELMQLLIEKTRCLQREVAFEDMRGDPTMPPPNTYAFYAGSFKEAAEEAWMVVRLGRDNSRSAKPSISAKPKVVCLGSKSGQEMSEEQRNALADKWLDWLYELGGGVLPQRIDVKRDYKQFYDQILEVFGNWMQVEFAFSRRKDQSQIGESKEAESLQPESNSYFEATNHFENEKHFEVNEDFEESNLQSNDHRIDEGSKRWDVARLKTFLLKKYKESGEVARQKDIRAWSAVGICPSYPTCMKLLEGLPKAEWEGMLLEWEKTYKGAG